MLFTDGTTKLLLARHLKRLACLLLEIRHSILEALSDGGQALIITHGGFIEAGAVACLPHADYSCMGGKLRLL